MKQLKHNLIKTSLISLLMSFSLYGRAQVDSLRLTLDNIFAHVDKSQVSTGFLEEYGAQFANLKTYNGILTDSNCVNAMAWHYIYASVYSAKIYGTNTLPTPDSNYSVFNREAVLNKNINPVSMLALNYSSLKQDAMDNNLFTISNNQLYDVPGRTQSPYQLNTAFAAAPFYETNNNGTVHLLFKQNLFINNTGKQVSSIKVNFDDGNGFVTAAWNTILSASYYDTGVKKLTFKLNFTDTTHLQCYSNVRVLNAAVAGRYIPSTVTIPFDPVSNNHSGGDITVQYSVNNSTPVGGRKFQKPLIVVEGFDMHDAAPLLMPVEYNYESFRKEISQSIVSFNGNDFNYNLDNIAGYDLIFLNYRDGTDDILRNALLLEEVINWVNSNKAIGAQQNVVMGISMGGLVSRYCLAKMTKENHNPQTRLLITHDSPHRGANIPLGFQYVINGFANHTFSGDKLLDLIPLLKQAVYLQTRPATIQQLIVRDNPETGALEYNTFLAPNGPYRQMVTFAPTDLQPTYQFIATSQGSQCGMRVMAPSASIAQTSGEAGFNFILGMLGGKFSGELKVNALPNGTSSQRIAYCLLKTRIKIFWIGITTTILKIDHNSPAGILGWDGCPAGTQSVSRGTGMGNIPSSGFSTGLLRDFFYSFSGVTLAPEFSFLPVVSALDEDNITASSLYTKHLGAFYNPSDPNVVQKYIAQQKQTISGVSRNNITHTDFTARNANWLFNEMEGLTNTIGCTDLEDCYLPYIELSATPNDCGGAAVTAHSSYSGSFHWQASGGLLINGTLSSLITTSNTINVTGTEGSVYVIAPAACGNAQGGLDYSPYQRQIQRLYPEYTSGDHVSVSVNPTPFDTYYRWYINNTLVSQGEYESDYCTCYYRIDPRVCGDNTIRVEVTTDCGVSSVEEHFWKICGPFRSTSNVEIFPNPARDQVIIRLKQTEGKEANELKNITQVKIMDKLGNVKKVYKYSARQSSVLLNLNALPTDIFIIEVSDGQRKANLQLGKIK